MTSKIQRAKDACGYSPAPVLPVCGNCDHFRSEPVVIPWVLKELAEKGSVRIGMASPYHRVEDLPEQVYREGNLRCSKHGFAVKKQGACRDFSTMQSPATAIAPN